MAAGIVLVKVIGAIFKIPLGNILGDEGFGHFNNAYVIYSLLMVISTTGLPVALSKTISEAHTLGRNNQVRQVFRVASVTFFVLGVVSSVVMFFFAGNFADILSNPGATLAIRALAGTCLFVCIISAFRGYAQGHANMVPTATSQVFEALGKLLVGIVLAWFFMSRGEGTEKAAAGAIAGVTVGALIALVYLIYNFRRNPEPRALTERRDRPHSSKRILQQLMIIAVPITITASISPITTMIDTYQVQNILRVVMDVEPAQFYRDADLVDPVIATYGAYQKAITIYNLPAAFIVALTTAVIPAISACWAKRNRRGATQIAVSSLRVGALLILPAGVGLSVLAAPIMNLLYRSTDHAVADPCMALLGIASIFVCQAMLCSAILQASGFVNVPVAVMAVGCVLKIVVNNFLVRQAGIGILGAPVGTIVCYVIITAVELWMIKRVISENISYRQIFGKPLIATAAMGGCAWGVSGVMSRILVSLSPFQRVAAESNVVELSWTGNAISTMLAIGVAVIVYAALVVFLRAITKDDLSLMPKGDKIAAILRIRN